MIDFRGYAICAELIRYVGPDHACLVPTGPGTYDKNKYCFEVNVGGENLRMIYSEQVDARLGRNQFIKLWRGE